MSPEYARSDAWGGVPPADASLTVILVDDSRSQAVRIQHRLAPYRIGVVWRPSYRAVAELLRDPSAGQLVDLVLIDQAFESAPDADLLTHSEVDALAGAEAWDVKLHQGLFIMTRLSQDMRDGRIPATPMMILTHYARLEIAAQVGPGGYESKRRLLADPYASLEVHLPQMQPTAEDVERRLRRLAVDTGLDAELEEQVRRAILGGLDPEDVCAAVGRLADPNDWRTVGRALEQLADERRDCSVERVANALAAAWLPSREGWLRVSQVETLGPLGHGFEAFRVEITCSGPPFAALVAVRPVPATAAPSVAALRRGIDLMREVDPRSRPLRLRDRSWTILGCWLPVPEHHDPAATGCGLAEVTRHVHALHGRGLVHGSLTALTAGFAPPVFGGVRCVTGEHDLEALREDDRRGLTSLAAATFGDDPDGGAACATDRWSEAVEAGNLDLAASVLASAHLRHGPPACVDFGREHSGDTVGFRDLLLAGLCARDSLLRDVSGDCPSAPPLDFVVCVGGVVAVLEHRSRVGRVTGERGEVVDAEAGPGSESDRSPFTPTVARCLRSAGALAGRVEAGLGLPRGSVGRRAAVVVSDRAGVRSAGGDGWRAVMTESEVLARLGQLSRTAGAPSGVQMLPHLPGRPPGDGCQVTGTRALHWTTVRLGSSGGVRMRTWSKRWPPESWRALLSSLATAEDALRPLPLEHRPLPLVELRAYDGDGGRRDLVGEAAAVELVEYDLLVPADAAPLPTYPSEAPSEVGRRRLAVAVLRSLLRWERLRLSYGMKPDGLLHAGCDVYADLLQSVAAADAESWWRQRHGAAACLVLLLSPWPFVQPTALAAAAPGDERSAWGIASTAVSALLDPDRGPRSLTVLLAETADLLEAAARLGPRFPSWPVGLAREAAS